MSSIGEYPPLPAMSSAGGSIVDGLSWTFGCILSRLNKLVCGRCCASAAGGSGGGGGAANKVPNDLPENV